MTIKDLFPLIVPAEYVSSGWNLPHYKFPVSKFVLTWVEFKGTSAMNYITDEKSAQLNRECKNWQQQTFENLRLEGDYFHTHKKYRKNTKHLIYISFLNADGIGSSRILLNFELSKGFSKGYYIAFPDRSCGVVISKDINEQELEEINAEIKNMYKNATTHMSGEIYNSMDFALPNEWIYPIDEQFSMRIINAIPEVW